MNPRIRFVLAVNSLALFALVSCDRRGADGGEGAHGSQELQTAGLTVSPVARPQASRTTPEAEVVGIQVHVPTANSTDSFERLGFAGTFNRSRLAIQVHYRAGGLIDLLRDESRIEWFGDDRGTDLVDPEELFGPVEMMPEIAEDGRSVVFVVGSKRSPHAQASRLEARGSIVAVCATATAHEEAAVTFRKGESFTLGPFAFEITAVGKSQWSDGWSLELASKTDLAPIIRYSVGADGADEELQRTSSMSGMGQWRQTLTHPEPLEAGTLRVEYWSDTSTVELPFSVSAGLGLR